MPRKTVLKPATARQVIEFYETASEESISVVADIATGIVEKRFAKKSDANTKAKPGRKPRPVGTQVSEPAGD